MPVTEIHSASEFEALKSSSQLLVIDFYATWCGPCKAISPIFDKLADDSANAAATFGRIDVDKVKDVARAMNITAMPTFIFILKGKQVDELKGSDRYALESKVKKHVSALDSVGPSLVRGMTSLSTKLDIKQLELLNATTQSSARSLFEPSSKVATESDSDEQLMIYAPFQEAVKTHSIVLRVQPDDLNHAPSKLRIYVNRPNILSFDDVESLPSTQEISAITYDPKGTAIVPLRYVKFQKVNSLVIFVEANMESEDVTKLLSLEILGEVSPMNSSGVVQKIDHDHE